MGAKIFDANDKVSTDGIEEDVEEADKETLDLPMTQSYSYAVTMIYMY